MAQEYVAGIIFCERKDMLWNTAWLDAGNTNPLCEHPG